MSVPTTRFFEALGERGHEVLLEEASGTIRFDLTHEQGVDHWFLAIDRGDVCVSRYGGEADSVISGSRTVLDRAVAGQTQLYAAWLRNEITIKGRNRSLPRLFSRLMPGAPGSHHPREFHRERKRSGVPA